MKGGIQMLLALIGSILLISDTVLYVLILLGLPLGDFVMGGKQQKATAQLRVAIAISIPIQLFAILLSGYQNYPGRNNCRYSFGVCPVCSLNLAMK